MGRFDDLVPYYIRTLGGYAPGKPLKQAEAECGFPCVKLASNENPFGPSPRALEAIYQAAPFLHFYPDNDATDLRYHLADKHNVKPEQVLVTGGSTQFLNIIVHSLLLPGLNAVTCERSFIIYPIATQAAGGTLKQVPLRNERFDLDRILEAIDDKTRVVFIANPNNPTGTILDAEDIDSFIDRVPPNVLVVLDEAYYEFAEHFAHIRGGGYSHGLEYVRQERNVIVLRTFSKAQGLAGLRVGYGFGPAELIQYFARERTAFSINTLAEAAALAALEDTEHMRKTVENNAAGVAWMTKQLSELGLHVVPTWCNFLYVEIGEDAPAVAERLQQEGIIVRPLTGLWGAPHAIRISIGLPDHNQRCISALKKVAPQAAGIS